MSLTINAELSKGLESYGLFLSEGCLLPTPLTTCGSARA